MRVDQKMSVSIGSSDFQIVIDDAQLAHEFLSDFEQWKTEVTAGPGFRITSPTKLGGLRVALGADGAPIVRSRRAGVVATVLRRHLDALIGGAQHECRGRLGLRAILGPTGAALVDPTLLTAQPVIERRFSAESLRIVDSPYVDLATQPDSVALLPVPRSGFSSDDPIPGHASNPPGETVVKALLWRGLPGGAEPSTAQEAHALAGVTRAGSRHDRIELAVELAERIPTIFVDATQPSSLVAAAAEVLSPK